MSQLFFIHLFFYAPQHNPVNEIFLQERIHSQHRNHSDENFGSIQGFFGNIIQFLNLIHGQVGCLYAVHHLLNICLQRIMLFPAGKHKSLKEFIPITHAGKHNFVITIIFLILCTIGGEQNILRSKVAIFKLFAKEL